MTLDEAEKMARDEINLQHLRALCEKASDATPRWYEFHIFVDSFLSPTDAAYVAAANPQTVLALIEEVERLRDEASHPPGTVAKLRIRERATSDENAELRSQLAAMTKARDEACVIADQACEVLVDLGDEYEEEATPARERVAELRKVGQ